MSEVTKQQVKDRIDNNEELSKKLKGTLIDDRKWKEFKGELSAIVEEFSRRPTPETKQKLDNLIETYSMNRLECQDAIKTLFRDLGVRQDVAVPQSSRGERKSQTKSSKQSREVLESLGFESPEDFMRRTREEIRRRDDERYGIDRTRRPSEKRTVRRPEARREEENKKPKVKKQGKIKSALVKAAKKAYHKLTASMIMAPGTVPKEILEENRKMLDQANAKVGQLIDELEIASKSATRLTDDQGVLDKVPYLQKSFAMMRDGEMLDEEYSELEEDIDKDISRRKKYIRANFEVLQEGKLREELRAVLEEDIDISDKEIALEIETVLKETKLTEDGKLILPKGSMLEAMLFDENGKLLRDKRDLVLKLSKYVQMPKVAEFSDEELFNLAKKNRKVIPGSREAELGDALSNNPELAPDNASELMDEMEQDCETIEMSRFAKEEVETRHKLLLAKGIKGQFAKIYEIVQDVDQKEQEDGELDKNDSKSREIALKIARKKVKSLEKARLFDVISDGDKRMRTIIKEARAILLPELANAHEKGTKRLNKEYDKQFGETEEEPDRED